METLSAIIPTRNEAGNIVPLVKLLQEEAELPKGTTVYFIDDSTDEAAIAELEEVCASNGPLDLHFEPRPSDARIGGLSGAVIHGYHLAKPGWWLVMDGDGQHPPITIPLMVAMMRAQGADIVVASRYIRGGSASGLNGPLRHAVSRLCTWLAKGFFPLRLRGVSDPMTGCYLVRSDKIDPSRLQASGFKILLELLVTHPHLKCAEVPMKFAARKAGNSKGNLRNGLKFLQQLFDLRFRRSI